MPSITETPPAAIRVELTRLRRQLGRNVPKKTDRNLLIATWNIREFGNLTRKWNSTQADTPKRDLHALACIKEIVKRFDVVAIQEAQKSLGALRRRRGGSDPGSGPGHPTTVRCLWRAKNGGAGVGPVKYAHAESRRSRFRSRAQSQRDH